MKIVIDIPNSLYANLKKIANGSNACKRLLECVKAGEPVGNTDKAIDAIIDNAPTVDNGYQEGYWIKSELATKCSVCKGTIIASCYNYCPNCGTKMR